MTINRSNSLTLKQLTKAEFDNSVYSISAYNSARHKTLAHTLTRLGREHVEEEASDDTAST